MEPLHPILGPGECDAYGEPPQLVVCPDCGQLEWWSEIELADHGQCRTYPGPCPVCMKSDEPA
jgi:hypothetical protein